MSNIKPFVEKVNNQLFKVTPIAQSFSDEQNDFFINRFSPFAGLTPNALRTTHLGLLRDYLNAPSTCVYFSFRKVPTYTPSPDGALARLASQIAQRAKNDFASETQKGGTEGTLPDSEGKNTPAPNKAPPKGYKCVSKQKFSLNPPARGDFEMGFLVSEAYARDFGRAYLRNAEYITKDPLSGREITVMGAYKYSKAMQWKRKNGFMRSWKFWVEHSEFAFFQTLKPHEAHKETDVNRLWLDFYSVCMHYIERVQETRHCKVLWALDVDSNGLPHMHLVILDNEYGSDSPYRLAGSFEERAGDILKTFRRHGKGLSSDLRRWDKNDSPEYLMKNLSVSAQDMDAIDNVQDKEQRMIIQRAVTLFAFADQFKLRLCGHPEIPKNASPQKEVLSECSANGAVSCVPRENVDIDTYTAEYREEIFKKFAHCVQKACGVDKCAGCLFSVWLNETVIPWKPGLPFEDFDTFRARVHAGEKFKLPF